MLTDISTQDFSKVVLNASKPIAVDFYGPDCGTCVYLAAALEDISGDYEGEVDFVKLDVSLLPDVAAKYDIRSVPTLLFFKNGEVSKRVLGNQTRSKLVELIDAQISGSL
jgi:thioredoxin 1